VKKIELPAAKKKAEKKSTDSDKKAKKKAEKKSTDSDKKAETAKADTEAKTETKEG